MKTSAEVAGAGFLVSLALLDLMLSFGPGVKVTEILFFLKTCQCFDCYFNAFLAIFHKWYHSLLTAEISVSK